MAKLCDICGKTHNKAKYVNKLRGKYNRCGIKTQKPNLQFKKIDGLRILVCSNCLKALTKMPRTKKVQKTVEA